MILGKPFGINLCEVDMPNEFNFLTQCAKLVCLYISKTQNYHCLYKGSTIIQEINIDV